jgi:photosystem II stability/assembly factor-like uncharacterized protein
VNREKLRTLRASNWLAAMGLLLATQLAAASTDLSNVKAAPLRSDRVILLDVAMAGKRVVAVGERGVVMSSDDDGATWVGTKSPVTRTLTALTFIDANVGIAVGHGGSILRTEDAGKTWTQVKVPEIGSDSVLGITHLGGKEAIAYGGFGMYIRTEDAGKTWNRPHILSKEESYDRHIYKIAKTGSTLVLAAENGSLGRSTDNGKTYTAVPSQYPGSYFGAVTAKDNSVVIFGMRGTVYRSTDAGVNWTKIPMETKIGINNGLVLADGRIVLVGNSGLVAVSKDNGVSFKLAKTSAGRGIAQVVAIGPDKLLSVGEAGVAVLDPEVWQK